MVRSKPKSKVYNCIIYVSGDISLPAEEDDSPFGNKGGLFSSGGGLFDDDDDDVSVNSLILVI